MLNDFKYSDTNKRYHTLDYYFKNKFDTKVGRIPINAGFTCPNINGEKGFGGCTFCNINGSGDFAGKSTDSLDKQWRQGKIMMQKKWPDAEFIAYFQAFTNTYAPLEVLKEKYNFFINKDDCIGISIATRPDCLDDETIEYLSEINQKTFLMIELGLQSSKEETGILINKQYDLACFDETVKKLRQHNINVVVHIINGLPKENKTDMLNTVKYLSNLDIQGVKIHLLHVMDKTILVNQLNNGFLKLLTLDEYIDIVVDQLRLLPPEVVVHRLTGDAPNDIFIGPIWSKNKVNILNKIDQKMAKYDIYQGDKFTK